MEVGNPVSLQAQCVDAFFPIFDSLNIVRLLIEPVNTAKLHILIVLCLKSGHNLVGPPVGRVFPVFLVVHIQITSLVESAEIITLQRVGVREHDNCFDLIIGIIQLFGSDSGCFFQSIHVSAFFKGLIQIPDPVFRTSMRIAVGAVEVVSILGGKSQEEEAVKHGVNRSVVVVDVR